MNTPVRVTDFGSLDDVHTWENYLAHMMGLYAHTSSQACYPPREPLTIDELRPLCNYYNTKYYGPQARVLPNPWKDDEPTGGDDEPTGDEQPDGFHEDDEPKGEDDEQPDGFHEDDEPTGEDDEQTGEDDGQAGEDDEQTGEDDGQEG